MCECCIELNSRSRDGKLDWRYHGSLPCDGMTLPAVADNNTSQRIVGASVGVQILQCDRLHVKSCRKDITSPPVLQRVGKREVFVVRRQSICSARMTLAPIAVSICLPEDGVPKHTPFPSFADS